MNKRMWYNLRRDSMVWVLVAGLLLVVALAAWFVLRPQMAPRTTMHLGDGVFTARIIEKPGERALKASEFHSLGDTEAMLFQYENAELWPVEMHKRSHAGAFDLVWLDQNQKVVHIVKNISVKGGQDTTYVPTKPARYVVELPFGSVERRAITIDSVATFTGGEVVSE